MTDVSLLSWFERGCAVLKIEDSEYKIGFSEMVGDMTRSAISYILEDDVSLMMFHTAAAVALHTKPVTALRPFSKHPIAVNARRLHKSESITDPLEKRTALYLLGALFPPDAATYLPLWSWLCDIRLRFGDLALVAMGAILPNVFTNVVMLRDDDETVRDALFTIRATMGLPLPVLPADMSQRTAQLIMFARTACRVFGVKLDAVIDGASEEKVVSFRTELVRFIFGKLDDAQMRI